LYFNCPGCKVRYAYDDVFEHASACDKLPASAQFNQSDIKDKLPHISPALVSNVPFVKTSIGNEVFVFDSDSLNVFVYNMLTRQASTFDLQYTATDNIYTEAKKSKKVLPHNF
jgi:hypothetical protein